MNFERIFHWTADAFYVLVSAALLLVSLLMVGFGMWEVWWALTGQLDLVTTLLDAIGLIVISVAVFDVSKYLMEEEVLRDRELRSAREARQTLTKFLVIMSIAVTLEALVFIFGAGTHDVNDLLYPTILLGVSALLVVSLGFYQRLSASAEHDVVAEPVSSDEPRSR